MEKATLISALQQYKTIRGTAAGLNVSASTIRYWMGVHDLKTDRARDSRWDIDELKKAAESSTSIREILSKIGMRDTGSIYATLRKVAAEAQIELPVFKSTGSKRKVSNEEMFIQGRAEKGNVLKRRMVEELGIANRCSLCPIVDSWNGLPIGLEVDHVNGNHTDNRIENLRILCPNCHSQTETYCKNKKN